LITCTEQGQLDTVVAAAVVSVTAYARFVRPASDGSSIDDGAAPRSVSQFRRGVWKVSIATRPDVFVRESLLSMSLTVKNYPPILLI
jgi:hypothetical protein